MAQPRAESSFKTWAEKADEEAVAEAEAEEAEEEAAAEAEEAE